MSSPNGQTPPPTYGQAVRLNITDIQVDQMQPQLTTYQPSVHLPTTTYQLQVNIPTYTPQSHSHTYPQQLHLPTYPPEHHQATDPQDLQQYVTHMEQQDHHLQRRTRHRQPQDEGQSSLWCFIGAFVSVVILIIIVVCFFVLRYRVYY
eukprot:GFUD01005012.1.p1 GENE.GFUD01005012.1~~GFUD01005012.1.p1  ORF type:complete len:148 (+),score=9.81 GFUD01005012.1:169-612(+)